MMGQRTATKPSRSDDVLDANEQARIANEVRARFDSMAPKRPIKPSRSESDSTAPPNPLPGENIPLPELEKFRSLLQSHTVFPKSDIDQDEFVETQYYKYLDSVDKQHHTTGSGFIKVGSIGGVNGYDLQAQNGHSNGVYRETTFRTNPATNDWIPSFEDDQMMYVSSKPNRSESG